MSGNKVPAWKCSTVWLLRLLVGLTFVVSGWAKAVDPYGFVYKIGDYLSAWGLSGVFPYEFVLVGAVALSIFEFTTGVLLSTGCWRRLAPLCALWLMIFMLPLTIYIAIANPVADCGCFGDLFVISNTATMLKNIALTVMIIMLMWWNKRAKTLFRPTLQWVVIAVAVGYSLILSIIGWTYQPVVDFRPYPIGSYLLTESSEESMPTYVYERDGEMREFTLDNLPDSTWTFVEAIEPEAIAEQLAIFDGEEEVTEDLLSDLNGKTLILVISEPDIEYLTRARFANELNAYAQRNGVKMFAIVASSDESFDLWKEYARPSFDVYSASDTALKQLARGSMALVMLNDGKVAWKRNFANIYPEILNEDNPLDVVRIYDDGRAAFWTALGFVMMLVFIFIASTLRNKGTSKKKTDDTDNTASPIA